MHVTNNTKEFTAKNEFSNQLYVPQFSPEEATVTDGMSILPVLMYKPIFKSTLVTLTVHVSVAPDFFPLDNYPRQFSMISVLVQKVVFSPGHSVQLKFKLILCGLSQGKGCYSLGSRS